VNIVMNNLAHVVREYSNGLLLVPDTFNSIVEDIVIRSDVPEFDRRDVAVISGGGSGHECRCQGQRGWDGTGVVEYEPPAPVVNGDDVSAERQRRTVSGRVINGVSRRHSATATTGITN
jgi:hypothetical protein